MCDVKVNTSVCKFVTISTAGLVRNDGMCAHSFILSFILP